MCTAATYCTKDFYFGRNLDLEYSYRESVTVTPRNFPFRFRYAGECRTHFALIGMAYVAENYPLYYDATNEKGLSMAGLAFWDSAYYAPEQDNGAKQAASYEFIPWVLGQCENLVQAREMLAGLRVTNAAFRPELPPSPLHWMIADRSGAIVVEATKDGVKIYDNPAGVLTNEPPFDWQMTNLRNYLTLTPGIPKSTFAENLPLTPYSKGMGALGLPGDLSSASRFVRAAFVRGNSLSSEDEGESVGQFFHILRSVEQPRGCCRLEKGKCEITIYSSCCNADKGIYYYTTYGNSQITAVDMHRENLDSAELISYPLIEAQQIRRMN